MTAIKSRATGPLTGRPLRPQASGTWVVAKAEMVPMLDEVILGGFSCDCNGRTLVQINRTAELDARVQLAVTCQHDGTRSYRPYRRMPWMVEEYVIHRQDWNCDKCGRSNATLQMLDGVIVGIEVRCPLCWMHHAIDLTLSALPADLRQSAFGIEPPQPLLAPPAYSVLRSMWECIQKQPTNSFHFVPHSMRHDSGRVHHSASGASFDVAIDHLSQLASARLIEDDDSISITKSGVIVCLREFGGAGA
jgi:hypothetical protein